MANYRKTKKSPKKAARVTPKNEYINFDFDDIEKTTAINALLYREIVNKASTTLKDSGLNTTGSSEYTVESKIKPKSSKDFYKKNKKRAYRSKLINIMSTSGFFNNNLISLIHSPLHTVRNNKVLRDVNNMRLNYEVYISHTTDYDVQHILGIVSGIVKVIIINGPLEHMPNMMYKALFLKQAVNYLRPDKHSYLVVCVKNRKQLKKEAELNNYPPDKDGYLVTMPDRNQSRIEGMDKDELVNLINYGRIGFIDKNINSILSPIEDSCIVISNKS